MDRIKLLIFLSILFLLKTNSVAAQTFDETFNYVPNNSFEDFKFFPIGWYYKGTDFDRVMSFWNSATVASPDAYGPNVRVPESWAEKGFGKTAAHSGKSMAGLTLYGCRNGKPHCREYIETNLRAPLVVGQKYVLELWVKSIERGILINNIGAHLSEKRIYQNTDEKIDFTATLATKNIIRADKDWKKISFIFTPQTPVAFLTLGNFSIDTLTLNESTGDNNFAYYYFDDVVLHKINPILQVKERDESVDSFRLEVGKSFSLQNVLFENDKSQFISNYNPALERVVKILKENPNLDIAIIGHTDDNGTPEYNLTLSKARAKKVMDYLIAKGIDAARLQFDGYGERLPLVANINDDARKKNRRVEFVIIKK